ncbi:thiamine pyrophosphate-binding protein [Rhodococcus rhodnii]|uniref:acetolactate synthase n=2 Tax=Rhodococcus rhodnii TaxID=38312 RepID=R7WNB9_9NOCA|nr:thiamine pyrophosphate-binding protein [Rhodococcus rhodnii]EOM75514.1 sulfoacetaldehyde acetyltransferase [Rhodococcus rhodnii LMG 5362]TXG90477.1 thiamine pyrophosphate-binding protein [Rhodococcus rhodnii]
MYVRDAIGRTLHELGVRTAFGVVGSGNFHYTNAFTAAGGRFVAARHEGGAASMADGYARMSGEVTVLSLHQGCGYTNSLTGVAEAAKSNTPLLVVTAEATTPMSNFFIDQAAIAEGLGARTVRVRSAASAVADVTEAYRLAAQGRTVVLNVPIDVQDELLPDDQVAPRVVDVALPRPSDGELAQLVELLTTAERPVFVAGRGARSAGAKEALAALADRTGALLATSAVSKGMFREHDWSIDVSGGFSTPLAAELISDADLIVGWGCALNMWTMRHGKLIGDDARVVQVDLDPAALGRTRPIDLGLWGGIAETAHAATTALGHISRTGYRTSEIAERIRTGLRWNDVPYTDASTETEIDPRILTSEIDTMLPAERVVSVDSGNFLGFPSMFLDVPDEYGFCFTQAFQSVGLGLATAIGAALAQPTRLPVAGCSDGGFLMGISELDTAVRLGLPLLVIVYNDSQYGAEVHHFTGDEDLTTVTFPDTDIAAIAKGFGCDSLTVRRREDLAAVKTWLDAEPARPLVVDAKTVSNEGSWWLVEAFGH